MFLYFAFLYKLDLFRYYERHCFLQATVASSIQPGSAAQEQVEETASQDSNSDIVARTPPPKSAPAVSSALQTPVGGIKKRPCCSLAATSFSFSSTFY